MKKLPVIIFAITALTSGLWLSACRPNSEKEPQAPAVKEETSLTVTLSPEAARLADIQTAVVEFRPVIRSIRAPGEIAFNPRLRAHVTSRAKGRIERLSAFPGDRVREGQMLLSLYSQDFLSLQAELLQASARLRRLADDASESLPARSFLESVRSRLRLLGISETEAADIEKTGQFLPLLPVRAPLAGSIIESAVTAGDFVEVGASLFRIANMSTVWAIIHINEKDLRGIGAGSQAAIWTGTIPDRKYKGRIFQMGSTVDEKTRTVEGRAELANPEGDLKPGLFIEAEVASLEETRALFVPGSAVQEYRNSTAVFARDSENIFHLREVKTGLSLPGYVEILEGLSEKETVVTGGSFFLKSELLKKNLEEE